MSGPDSNAYEDAKSAYAPRDQSSAKSAQIVCTNAATAYSSQQLTAGQYMIWVKGGLHSDVLSFKRGATNSASVSPATATPASVDEMPGDWIEKIRVTDAEPYVWVNYTSAGYTVQLSRIGN